MTGFDSKRQAAKAKLTDEADTLTIVYQKGYADGKQAAQRPWVGLTDEFCITNMFDMGHYSLQIVFKSRKNADEFKAALKELNA